MKLIKFLLLAFFCASSAFGVPMGAGFTYQGRLNDGNIPATGLYDLRFELFDSQSLGSSMAPARINSAVAVTNGVFTTMLDFGASAFNGEARWLDIQVRTNGSTTFFPLTPRQPISPTPYAMHAETAQTVANISSGQAVKSINGMRDNVNLVAGANVTLTPSGNNLTIASSPGAFSLNGASAYYNGGNVGIGTATPAAKLHVAGDEIVSGNLGFGTQVRQMLNLWGTEYGIGVQSGTLYQRSWGTFAWHKRGIHSDAWSDPGADGSTLMTLDDNFLTVRGAGNEKAYIGGDGYGGDVQIGSLNAAINNLVAYNAQNNTLMDFVARNITAGGEFHTISDAHGMGYRNTMPDGGFVDGPFIYGWNGGALGVSGPDSVTLGWDWHGNVWVRNNLSTCSLTIRGGCDLAEPFEMTEENIPKGAVVVIDEKHEGRLKRSTHAYDTRVAGIVSGANGINPGISLHQEGALEGGQNVALTGRVYVNADASYGAIKPGDLLTTSDTPGHAMKVSDPSKAQGAILGKAMTALGEGTGMVLVLVSLQ